MQQGSLVENFLGRVWYFYSDDKKNGIEKRNEYKDNLTT
tara:strand:+ start:183 stop:299 length:117 start_codon:yes stop_codon:yes gene_type:complete